MFSQYLTTPVTSRHLSIKETLKMKGLGTKQNHTTLLLQRLNHIPISEMDCVIFISSFE